MFSPYYAWARGRGVADPLDHCAVNVALYGSAARRWAMTERRRSSVARQAASLQIGPSALEWHDDMLELVIDEWACPIPARIRGRVRLTAPRVHDHEFHLDAVGAHRWSPIAPAARVHVELDYPRLRWSGHGYFDSNAGDEPLEEAFSGWDWSRVHLADGSTAVLYDVRRRDGMDLALALQFTPDGSIEWLSPPGRIALPTTRWRIARSIRSEAPGDARLSATLEDTPFYARSLLATRLAGETAPAIHETLSLDRFRTRWVKLLLPFRMPRAWR